jgi:hypothetical protein
MRKLIYLVTYAAITGCATNHINYHTINPPDRFYKNILLLYIEGELNFVNLDEETYQKELAGRYNNLADIEYRQHLEKSISRYMNGLSTKITRSSRIYPLNQPVSYTEFMEKIQKEQVEAIFLINLNTYWYETSGSFNPDSGEYFQDSEPNASYHFYLVDVNSLKPVCMGVSRIHGLWAGYNTLNNKFAREVARTLHRTNFVFISRKGY